MQFPSRVKRALSLFLPAVAILFTLSGCAVAPLEASTVMKGNEGVVVVRLVANTQPTLEAHERWMFLKVQPESGASVSMGRRAYGNYSTGVFTGVLPPGRYTLSDLEAVFGTWNFSANLNRFFPPFEVRAGEVTMLGTIVYVPGPEGRQFTMGLIDAGEEDFERLATEFPDLARQMAGKRPSGFIDGPQLAARRQTAATAKRASAAINTIYQPEPGDFYAGSRLGVVLMKRRDAAAWTSHDTGSTREILAVTLYKGAMLAAGEEGVLMQSSDGGKSWARVASPDPSATVISLQQGPDGALFALCRREKELVLYRSGALPADWKSVATFKEEQSLLNPVLRIQVLAAEGKMYVVMPGAIYAVDLGTSQYVRQPNSISSFYAGVLPGGFMYSWGVSAVLTSLYLSDDAGKTWSDAKASRFLRSPVFKDRMNGYSASPRAPGIFPGEFAIGVTTDGGLTWTPSGKWPEIQMIERELHVDRSDGSILFVGRNGMILRTRDVGGTWRRER